jgi:ATP phosphoribosyltransferase regulatory subunit
MARITPGDAHPSLRLPAGMRDFAPAAAAERRRIAETLLRVFERWGYARVITPAFEYEDVLALGLGSGGREAAIRFVEPSSGQVVALRPDITPQIARLIATRFRDEPGPLRLCYEGTVVRLDRRARSQRELIQAGVELAGVASPGGDAEMIALGAAALAAAGLDEPTIDLGHLGLAREVLNAVGLPDEALELARGRIAKRDGAGLAEVLRAARGPRAVVDFARRLPELSGPPSILAAAIERAPTPGIRRALENLDGVVRALAQQPLAGRLHVDLGEVRGFDYYTGIRLQGFVEGASEPVLQGGRYDSLLGRYGRPCPAVGFAIDVEATASAIEAAPGGPPAPAAAGEGNGGAQANGSGTGGVLVSGPARAAGKLADELRAQGKRAAVDHGGLRGEALDAYARRWQFSQVVRLGASSAGRRPKARSRNRGNRGN